MRTKNRGDVPAPHAPPGQAKNAADPADDVVFDAGSLSFVQDWVVDGGADGGGGGAAAAEIEPEREDPRQSNPNRRLGVGAQPKKPKQERVSHVRCCSTRKYDATSGVAVCRLLPAGGDLHRSCLDYNNTP